MVAQAADEMLVGQRAAQHRIGQLRFDQTIAVELWIVFLQQQMMVGADLAAIAGDRQNIERAGKFAERSAGDDERRVPVQNAALLDAWRQGGVGEIDPVNAAELYWVTKRSLIGTDNGVWHPGVASPPKQKDIQWTRVAGGNHAHTRQYSSSRTLPDLSTIYRTA